MSEAKWYVVHTYSGYENKVKANIDKAIENRHLEDQILEVRVPMEEATELRNGVQKAVQRKMFPGYVMIHMVMNDDTWYVVRNTRGVTGFVGPGSKPVPLEEHEMENLGIQRDNVIVNFGVGDMVVVLSGAWEGTVGTVQSMNEQKKRLGKVYQIVCIALVKLIDCRFWPHKCNICISAYYSRCRLICTKPGSKLQFNSFFFKISFFNRYILRGIKNRMCYLI